MNAITRIPSEPGSVVAGSVVIPQFHACGGAIDLALMRLMLHGVTLDVRLDAYGRVTLPRGVVLGVDDLAAIEHAAHAAFLDEVIQRFAEQRLRRQAAIVARL